jgi:predicted CoA-binding protein
MDDVAARHDFYADGLLRRVLGSVRTIAMVGASPDWNRPSSFAMTYLQSKGYRVIPVNPKAAGQIINGERCYASLADIPQGETGPIDMVDVFRNSEAAGPIAEEAIAVGAKVLWMQIGVRNDAAAARAEAAGLTVIMNRCPKIEWGRLNGELSWGGFNSRIISSKRRRPGQGEVKR